MADHAHNLRARSWKSDGPIGVPTRGTTGFNRLRKADRWLINQPAVQRQFQRAVLHEQRRPTAIDVGYGASHTTTCEWARYLRKVQLGVEVIGLEIEPARVLPPRDGVRFELGGFELAGHTADVVRAFNVLRQYDVDQVWAAWETMRAGLHPGGLIVEGTCDELGRRASWILLSDAGPQSLTLSWSPDSVERPSDVAERLPKVLIHNNQPGYKIHDILQELDAAWDRAAPLAVFGPRARWREAKHAFLADQPAARKLNSARRTQDNSITLPFDMVHG